MHAYCVGRLRLSEDAAYRRIQAARAALGCPDLFFALADGRLNLSSVCLLAPHLSKENVRALIAAATHRTNAFIREWLAERFAPAARSAPAARQLAVSLPRLAVQQARADAGASSHPLALETVAPPATPLSYERRFEITPEDEAEFRYAQALLSHAVPSGDVAEIYRRAMALLVKDSEKERFGATARKGKGGAIRGRQVPAPVRRAVWTRDAGRCSFVGPAGHSCGSRTLLEFDHIVPVARGGRTTEVNLRLRCRSHNQLEARRAFGAKFMRDRRRKAFADRAQRVRDQAIPIGP